MSGPIVPPNCSIRKSALMCILLMVAMSGCSDHPTQPRAPGAPTAPNEPSARYATVDTINVLPGVPVTLRQPRPAGDVVGEPSSWMLVRPIAGTVTEDRDGGITYVADSGSYGRDLLSYALTGEEGGQVVRSFVIRISARTPRGGEESGVQVLQEALLPVAGVPERIRYAGADLSDRRIRALRPLVAEIMSVYPPSPTALDTARVLRDWLARTAIHPYPPLHPDGSTANIAVLPQGATWSDVNALYHERLDDDSAYWTALYMDGVQMLERLLGSDAVGVRGEGGMMERVGPARYRIRDLDTYRFTLCSYQSQMLIALWAAAGLHGMMVPTVGHDASAVFIPDAGRWIYMDPTYNEEYAIDGGPEPLSPVALLAISTAGRAAGLTARGISGPYWDRSEYISANVHPLASYVGEHPDGFTLVGSQLNNAVTTPFGVPVRNVQLATDALAADPFFGNRANFEPVIPSVAFPDLGVGIIDMELAEDHAVIHLSSSLPGHVRFERRPPGGQWVECPPVDVVRRGRGVLEYRSVDATGASGMTARVRV